MEGIHFTCFFLYKWHLPQANQDIHHHHHVIGQDVHLLLVIKAAEEDMTVDPDLLDATRALRPGVIIMKKVNVDPQEALTTLDILATEAADTMVAEAVDALAL